MSFQTSTFFYIFPVKIHLQIEKEKGEETRLVPINQWSNLGGNRSPFCKDSNCVGIYWKERGGTKNRGHEEHTLHSLNQSEVFMHETASLFFVKGERRKAQKNSNGKCSNNRSIKRSEPLFSLMVQIKCINLKLIRENFNKKKLGSSCSHCLV